MSVSFDISDVRALAADLGAAPEKVMRGIRPVVARGALNIKRQLQSEMSSSTHFRPISGAISYDTKVTGEGVEAEIGPDKSRFAGPLANIAYFGSSTGGGTVPDPQGALAAESDGFGTALGDLLEGAL